MEINLTEKGEHVIELVKQYFPSEEFSSKSLSETSGEKIYSATLKSLVIAGLIEDLGGSPKNYKASVNIDELLEQVAVTSKSSQGGKSNKALNKAKEAKDDEFYTRYEDIKEELTHYKDQFKDKIVYLPCDDPVGVNGERISMSRFWDFFVTNFNTFGLKKLIATHYSESGDAYKIWIDKNGDELRTDDDALQEPLKGNGDFASDECSDIMRESDIICTNPPFSIVKDFIKQIMFYEKQFLIVCPLNAFKYKDIFPYVKDNKIWTGYNKVTKFYRVDGSIRTHNNVYWMTNMPTTKKNEPLELIKEYYGNESFYPTIDNYSGAIFINKLVEIPKDWYGLMGVPITYFDAHCPEQFEIVDMENGPVCAGVKKYARIIIRRVKEE